MYQVALPTMPSGVRLKICWKDFTASSMGTSNTVDGSGISGMAG